MTELYVSSSITSQAEDQGAIRLFPHDPEIIEAEMREFVDAGFDKRFNQEGSVDTEQANSDEAFGVYGIATMGVRTR